jgi:hypothetical protein
MHQNSVLQTLQKKHSIYLMTFPRSLVEFKRTTRWPLEICISMYLSVWWRQLTKDVNRVYLIVGQDGSRLNLPHYSPCTCSLKITVCENHYTGNSRVILTASAGGRWSIGCLTRYRTRLAGGPLLRVATIRRTTHTHTHTLQTHSSSFLTQRTYLCSNFFAISSLVLELLKKCLVG